MNAPRGNSILLLTLFCPHVATEGLTILDVSVSSVKEENGKLLWNILGQKIKSQVKEKGNKFQIALDTCCIIGPLIQEDLKQIIEVRRRIPLWQRQERLFVKNK